LLTPYLQIARPLRLATHANSGGEERIRKEAAAAGRPVSSGPYLDSLFILHFSLPLRLCGGEEAARLVTSMYSLAFQGQSFSVPMVPLITNCHLFQEN
jgi:hypothetical protein